MSDLNEGINGLTGCKNFILYGPPGTGKTFDVVKFTKELGITVKKIGDIDTSRTFWHLAPGFNGRLWDKLKKGNRLGYEWCANDLGDLKTIAADVKNYNMKKRFSEVKKGDYFCVIRGIECLAIAEALYDYDFSKALNVDFEFQTIEVEWLTQFDISIKLNTTSTPSFSHIGNERWEILMDKLEEKGFVIKGRPSKNIIKELFKFTTFHQSYCYEDFIEGIKPRLSTDIAEDGSDQKTDVEYQKLQGVFYNACDEAVSLAGYDDLQHAVKDSFENRSQKLSEAKKYYLIIDEINRGNVANIFGELITLLEEDKRLGGQNEIMVSLPSSPDKKFGVPSNLVIIGTMNTADRSIEALDTALRRRFTFIERLPRPELLSDDAFKIAEVDLEKMLRTINDRLERLLDKDHLIGHSYFMKIKVINDIQNVFKNKIIPLLEEYFYGRPQMVGLVLGKGFVQEKSGVSQLSTGFDTEYSDFESKKIFQIVIPDNWDAYKKIYE